MIECVHSIRALVQSPESPALIGIYVVWVASVDSHLVRWGIFVSLSHILLHGHYLGLLILAFPP